MSKKVDNIAVIEQFRGVSRQETIDRVVLAVLVLLQRNRGLSYADMAARVANGNRIAIAKLIAGDEPNLALAQRIVDCYPEVAADIGEPIVCARCGRLPHFPRAHGECT